ncbi:uncharacterized protein RJT20DRAFT_124276 [Scheffersomyces xylosifermentans]|uniref:uncharacterized protein n=1 Tax=Scheffersomyces xylosifermentans TaxID=1304137 RepID=UPI00315C7B29
MHLKVITFLALLLTHVYAFNSVPVLVASHKLVAGLRSEIKSDNISPHNTTSVTNLIKKLISKCSSDEYIIVNQPGLTLEDLTVKHADNWGFLRKYLTLASTVIGLPFVEEPLDLPFLEKYVIRNCQAEVISVDDDREEEVTPYYDTRTRVIRINLSPLPSPEEGRYEVIREHDELIRKILRKLPSPHYTIILTGDTPSFTEPVPNFVIEENPNNFEIFNDIVNDPARAAEVERNDQFHKVEPHWIDYRHTNERYLRNKQRDEIHLFNNELWVKYEKLVTTITVMVLSLFMMKIISFFNAIKARVAEKRSKKGLIGVTKKED